MTDVALVREDTLDVLVFEGVTDLEVDHPGSVTDHAVPDRSTVADHILTLPRTARFSAVVAPAPGRPDLVGGPDRVQGVVDWLEQVQREGLTVSLQRPGQPALRLLAVESFRERLSNAEGIELEVELKGLRLQSAQTVRLGTIATKEPPEHLRAGQEDAQRVGNRPTKEVDASIIRAGVNELVDTAASVAGFTGVLP